MMTQKDTEQLIQKYLDGETSLEEEKQLALEVSRDGAPKEWKLIAEMLGKMTVDEAIFEKMRIEHTKRHLISLWPLIAAACAAILLMVLLAPPKKHDAIVQKIEKVQPEKRERTSYQVEKKTKLLPHNDHKKLFAATKSVFSSKPRAVALPKKRTLSVKVEPQEAQDLNPENINEVAQVEQPRRLTPTEQSQLQFLQQTQSIRVRGEQLIHRVAIINESARSNQYYTDL